LQFKIDTPLVLECGQTLQNLIISYRTYGQLNKDASNVIWICHALTADANPKNWWPGLVGGECLYNPDEYYIVCANIIGSAYGSTSPLNCDSDIRYNKFPHISIRDNIAAFKQLKNYLAIETIHTLIGGSMGGQQAMEWAIIEDNVCENLILLATSAVMSPWAVAFNQSQRLAIQADHSWGQPSETAASKGLKAARSIALLSYRNNQAYNNTQGDAFSFEKNHKVISYQNYQGDKLVNRFNAYSYHALTKTMDSHDVGRGRGGITKALASIKAQTLVIGIDSDLLFPIEESKQLADLIPNAGFKTIDSDFGHDGFLIESQQIGHCIENFYRSHSTQNSQAYIGLFGLGCVGQGFVELLQSSGYEKSINSIVVKHEYKARKLAHGLIGTNGHQVLNDTGISTIIEVINDEVQSYRLAKSTVEQGKHFISANKKMIAENLAEIIEWNLNNKASFLYEAAVAGSIPIIRNLDLYFDIKHTQSIKAIVNGTSNYILTQMFKSNCQYGVALQQAQNLGIAETDPTADVGGFDAKYKAVILAAHAFGFLVNPKYVINLGIQNISNKDILFAKSRGLIIKQIADIKITKNGIAVSVMPHFVKINSELAKTDNADNLIILNNNQTEFYFKGAGAGGIATATAIISDLKASEKNYHYNYQINKSLILDNHFNLKIYINKQNYDGLIKGNILEQDNDYLILETSINNLLKSETDHLFIANID